MKKGLPDTFAAIVGASLIGGGDRAKRKRDGAAAAAAAAAAAVAAAAAAAAAIRCNTCYIPPRLQSPRPQGMRCSITAET